MGMKEFVDELRAKLQTLRGRVSSTAQTATVKPKKTFSRLPKHVQAVVQQRLAVMEREQSKLLPDSFGDFVFALYIDDFLKELSDENIMTGGDFNFFIFDKVNFIIMKFIAKLPHVFHWEFDTKSKTFYLMPNENCFELTKLILEAIASYSNTYAFDELADEGVAGDNSILLSSELADKTRFTSVLPAIWLKAHIQAKEYSTWQSWRSSADGLRLSECFSVPDITTDEYKDLMYLYYGDVAKKENLTVSYSPVVGEKVSSKHSHAELNEAEQSLLDQIGVSRSNIEMLSKNSLLVETGALNQLFEEWAGAHVKTLEYLHSPGFARTPAEMVLNLVGEFNNVIYKVFKSTQVAHDRFVSEEGEKLTEIRRRDEQRKELEEQEHNALADTPAQVLQSDVLAVVPVSGQQPARSRRRKTLPTIPVEAAAEKASANGKPSLFIAVCTINADGSVETSAINPTALFGSGGAISAKSIQAMFTMSNTGT
jgi:hypothetical protein